MRIIAVLAFLSFLVSQGVELVSNGKSRHVIVLSPKCSILEKRAAEDLSYHLSRMSGAKLPVVKERPADAPAILLGRLPQGTTLPADLGRNGFVLRDHGDDLYISGNPPAGIAEGIYYLLEELLGVHWLWPGELGEYIPERKDVTLANLNVVFRQAIPSSRFHGSSGVAGWQDKAAGKTFRTRDEQWRTRHGFSWDSSIRSQHAYGHPGWKYGAKYLKTHPEWFNLLPDGTRRHDPLHVSSNIEYTSVCPSSAGLLEQVLKDWREKRAGGYPFGPNVFLGENDAAGSCCCPECLAADGIGHDSERLARAKELFVQKHRRWTDALGDTSGRYLAQYRRALELARQTEPNVKVIGWAAYANYYAPPPGTKLEPAIVLAFVGRLMFPWTEEKIAEFKRCWSLWHSTGCSLVLRPNFMLDGHNMPVNYARKMHSLLQFCLENGMIGAEFDSSTGQYAGNGFNTYVLGRMLRNPRLSYETIEREYCQAFGGAADDIGEYLHFWEKLSDSPEMEKACAAIRRNPVGVEVGGWNYFYTKAHLVFTQEVFDSAAAILSRAYAHAGTPLARQRVRFLENGLTHARLVCEAQRIHESGNKLRLAMAVAKLDDFRLELEHQFASDTGFLTKWENECWNRTSLRFMLNAPGKPFTDGWCFAFDPQNIGEKQGWFKADYNVTGWSHIGVDSGWERQSPGITWKKAHNDVDYDGVGWYCNTFSLSPADVAGKVELTFGAVDEACEIWLNGQKLLERPYPYQGDSNSWATPFTVDLSKAAQAGENRLAVRVTDKSGQGGIWRSVWLKVTPHQQKSHNLLRLGDFEDSTQFPKNWNVHIPKGTYSHGFDVTQAHSGKASYRMTCTKLAVPQDNIFKMAWMRIYQAIPVTPGSKLRFHGWYRSSPGFGGHCYIWLLGKGLRQEICIGDTNGMWAEFSLPECLVPEGTKDVTVYINHVGNLGTIWVDDLELTLGEK